MEVARHREGASRLVRFALALVPPVSLVTQPLDTTNAAADTQFTMFAVVKTYQTPGDVNPMGIVNLAKLSAQDGVGDGAAVTKRTQSPTSRTLCRGPAL